MTPKTVKINDRHGLHMRTAAIIAEKTQRFDAEIRLCTNNKCANGASVMELLMLDVSRDDTIKLEVTGKEAEALLRELAPLFIDGAGI